MRYELSDFTGTELEQIKKEIKQHNDNFDANFGLANTVSDGVVLFCYDENKRDDFDKYFQGFDLKIKGLPLDFYCLMASYVQPAEKLFDARAANGYLQKSATISTLGLNWN